MTSDGAFIFFVYDQALIPSKCMQLPMSFQLLGAMISLIRGVVHLKFVFLVRSINLSINLTLNSRRTFLNHVD